MGLCYPWEIQYSTVGKTVVAAGYSGLNNERLLAARYLTSPFYHSHIQAQLHVRPHDTLHSRLWQSALSDPFISLQILAIIAGWGYDAPVTGGMLGKGPNFPSSFLNPSPSLAVICEYNTTTVVQHMASVLYV